MERSLKPLGKKSYGSIGHLIGSRTGPGDHTVNSGQHLMCVEKQKDKRDIVYVTEKLDGCLYYSVKILTDQGSIPIGKIVNQKLKVNIISYNESTGSLEPKRILEYHKFSNDDPLLRIKIVSRLYGNNYRSVTCTRNHKFWVGVGYRKAEDLNVGDKVYHNADKTPYEMEQLLLGTLLGDASIVNNTEHSRFVTFSHTNLEYFEYKKMLLDRLFSEQKPQVGGFPGSKQNRRGITRYSEYLTRLIQSNCEVNGKKYITKDWVSKLSPISLAFLIQDDGSINYGSNNQRPRYYIYTNSFSKTEVEILQQSLWDKFGIDSKLHSKKSYKGNVLSINADYSEIVSVLIAPFVHESMKYKVLPQHRHIPCAFDRPMVTKESIIDTEILSIEELPKDYPNHNKKYDLTVEDNHNYFANGILTHNSNVGIVKINGNIYPLIRAGYLATNSKHSQHWDFANWTYTRENLFQDILKEGERIIGEWLQIAHGTRYNLNHEPFVPFDMMVDDERLHYPYLLDKIDGTELVPPKELHRGLPCTIEKAMKSLGEHGHHGAIDPAEGAVWRIERDNKTLFLAKYVRANKIDGKYFGDKDVYNMRGEISLKNVV